ncbi:zinc finger BED domain-containing protein RICESLEEPER 2-like [Eutrema salsugineum]|uniref:zinc finger BED domain-containing protein RICESLEEPER 2-like n=1 Tax=Eutrema salsugineum TaxID=72664 RepID=UPI000CED662C|nr:zinc finger BED domain-containing protein RICESLEEPER 2-like [Eutrema salsugineum]
MKRIISESKQRLSITTDIWVAPYTGASYMVVTAHFIDVNWKMKKMIIGFKKWGIKRVFCITVDNATANSSAMRKFKEKFKLVGDDAMVPKGEYLHLRCATHILNLIVREGLQEIYSSVSAIRNGVHYVRSSTNKVKAFDLRLETRKVTRGSLPLDVKTRWNSTYLMLDKAMKFRMAFEKIKDEDKPYNDYFEETVEGVKRVGPPTSSDWEAVDRLVQFLVIFYNSTLVLSASTSVTAHKLYNEIVTITTNISEISTTPGPDSELMKKADLMNKKLGKYWNPFGEKVEMNKLMIVAPIFDPRKKMRFAELCFESLYGKGSSEAIHLYDLAELIL